MQSKPTPTLPHNSPKLSPHPFGKDLHHQPHLHQHHHHPPTTTHALGGSPLLNNTLSSRPLTPIVFGAHYTVQSSAETLKKRYPEGAWNNWLEQICDGQTVGVAVRYTGDKLILMQFRPADKFCRSGHRYPFSVSLPSSFLVPYVLPRTSSIIAASPSLERKSSAKLLSTSLKAHHHASSIGGASSFTSDLHGLLPHHGIAPLPMDDYYYTSDYGPNVCVSAFSVGNDGVPRLCVVCGKWNQTGEVRKHGYKCSNCVGQPSSQRLRDEAERMSELDHAANVET